MCRSVNIQTSFRLKSFSTYFTVMGSVLRMSKHMNAQMITHCEPFPTNIAHVILLFHVNAHTVSFEIGARLKPFTTILARFAALGFSMNPGLKDTSTFTRDHTSAVSATRGFLRNTCKRCRSEATRVHHHSARYVEEDSQN